MKILSAKQIKEADGYTISHEPITSLNLMERAATVCFKWIIARFPSQENKFIVFVGNGNNGGDGLVIARLLCNAGYTVKVVICFSTSTNSKDFDANFLQLKKSKICIEEWNTFKSNNNYPDIIIDAIFGTGLNRQVEGVAAEVIAFINCLKKTVISIDMPSGLFADDNTGNNGKIINAQFTLTFQAPKLSFLLSDNYKNVGDFHVLDIGIHPDFIKNVETKIFFIIPQILKPFLLHRSTFQHKGNSGHACIISGSKGKTGASALATRACLKSGAGLVSVATTEFSCAVLQTLAPEAMCITSGNDYINNLPKSVYEYDAIGVGPGIGVQPETQNMLKLLIQQYKGKLVLDADALNILSENKTWLSFLHNNTVITPHPKEFDRLAGKSNSSFERYIKQKEFAVKFNVIVILKGAYTSIALPNGNTYFNSTGNSGMAKGGSGDILTGLITGLMARGYSAIQAAMLGVFVHGLAGDYAAENFGKEPMISSDIIYFLNEAYNHLYRD